jgi:hypothetical protein
MNKIKILIICLAFCLVGCKNEYDKGTQFLVDKKYDLALAEFEKIQSSDENYKRAQSKISYINGLNAYNKNKFDEAKVFLDKVDSYDENYNEVKVMLDKIASEEKSKKLESDLTDMDAKLKNMEIKMLNDAEKNKYNSTISSNDYRMLCGEYPEASVRYLMYSDIVGKTKRQLKIMRNEVFMRHGYIFKTDDMRKQFSNYPCYNPTYNDVTNMLSDIEKQNVEFIKQYE